MNHWMIASLLLYYISTSMAQMQCNPRREGQIQVTGVNKPSMLRAGWIRICKSNTWRVVCDQGWGIEEAKATCRQLGFPEEGALHCNRSCFGGNRGNGVTIASCRGSDATLADCPSNDMGRCRNNKYAGVLCYNTTILQAGPRGRKNNPESEDNTENKENSESENNTGTSNNDDCVVTGITLGGLAIVLFLILLAVVAMWVWSCYRRKATLTLRSDIPSTSFPNPTYIIKTSSSAHISAVQYSSKGPATPTGSSGHTQKGRPLPETEEREYHILEGEGEGRDADYEEIEEEEDVVGEGQKEEGGGMAYEVPIKSEIKERD